MLRKIITLGTFLFTVSLAVLLGSCATTHMPPSLVKFGCNFPSCPSDLVREKLQRISAGVPNETTIDNWREVVLQQYNKSDDNSTCSSVREPTKEEEGHLNCSKCGREPPRLILTYTPDSRCMWALFNNKTAAWVIEFRSGEIVFETFTQTSSTVTAKAPKCRVRPPIGFVSAFDDETLPFCPTDEE